MLKDLTHICKNRSSKDKTPNPRGKKLIELIDDIGVSTSRASAFLGWPISAFHFFIVVNKILLKYYESPCSDSHCISHVSRNLPNSFAAGNKRLRATRWAWKTSEERFRQKTQCAKINYTITGLSTINTNLHGITTHQILILRSVVAKPLDKFAAETEPVDKRHYGGPNRPNRQALYVSPAEKSLSKTVEYLRAFAANLVAEQDRRASQDMESHAILSACGLSIVKTRENSLVIGRIGYAIGVQADQEVNPNQQIEVPFADFEGFIISKRTPQDVSFIEIMSELNIFFGGLSCFTHSTLAGYGNAPSLEHLCPRSVVAKPLDKFAAETEPVDRDIMAVCKNVFQRPLTTINKKVNILRVFPGPPAAPQWSKKDN
ncbi:hypothetical protein EVAR_71444_1 [Eumeta japonica]|uniref:Uncharacterized protein n=1 Tax=Eumeta variegata TaxID=151549 RepID=A0A4C1SCR1_EUMVA|nr:hypothetical protein EVAR_71444_1 [Eumeta japonica]